MHKGKKFSYLKARDTSMGIRSLKMTQESIWIVFTQQISILLKREGAQSGNKVANQQIDCGVEGKDNTIIERTASAECKENLKKSNANNIHHILKLISEETIQCKNKLS